MKYLYRKSNIEIIIYISVYPVGLCLINALTNLNSMGLYFFCAILECVILYTLGYTYLFYEDYLEVIYHFRIIRRKKINYNSIKKVKYLGDPFKSLPEMQFYLNTKTRIPMCLNCISLKKILNILRFFNKKNIDVEIICSNKKKRNIIENAL